jgi:hypothetical protein
VTDTNMGALTAGANACVPQTLNCPKPAAETTPAEPVRSPQRIMAL